MRRRIFAFTTAVALVACSPAAVPVTAEPDPQVAVEELTATLDEALVAAKSYGMKRLGHYLEIDGAALVAEGFTAPDGIALAVQPDHKGVCLAAEHTGLPKDHEWRIASIDSRRQEPLPGNTCAPGTAPAEVALRTAGSTAAGGLICLLPPAEST